MDAMLPPARLGLAGPLGSGRQWWSWIHLEDLVGAARLCLEDEGLQTIAGDSPIVPVLLGDSELTLRTAELLERTGTKVAAIRPPTVPEGTARLRISLKAGNVPEELAKKVAEAVKVTGTT